MVKGNVKGIADDLYGFESEVHALLEALGLVHVRAQIHGRRAETDECPLVWIEFPSTRESWGLGLVRGAERMGRRALFMLTTAQEGVVRGTSFRVAHLPSRSRVSEMLVMKLFAADEGEPRGELLLAGLEDSRLANLIRKAPLNTSMSSRGASLRLLVPLNGDWLQGLTWTLPRSVEAYVLMDQRMWRVTVSTEQMESPHVRLSREQTPLKICIEGGVNMKGRSAVEMSLELGTFELSLVDALRIRPGATVQVEWGQERRAILRCRDRALAVGTMELREGQLMVHIDEVFSSVETKQLLPSDSDNEGHVSKGVSYEFTSKTF